MSFISRTQFSLLAQRLLLITQKRLNTRESIHKYREPNKFKKHMLAACEPYIRRRYDLPEETCKLSQQINLEHEIHPLNRILTNELLEDIKRKDFILLVQYNYTPFQSDRVYKNTITKLGGKFHSINNIVYKEAFKILGHENLCGLFTGRNVLITGRLDNLPGCVIAMRKMPQLLLYAGLIDNHLYNFDQIKAISQAGSIDQCLANLVSILDSARTINLGL